MIGTRYGGTYWLLYTGSTSFKIKNTSIPERPWLAPEWVIFQEFNGEIVAKNIVSRPKKKR